MTRLLLVLAALVAAVVLAQYSFSDTNYVVIGYREWVYQSSLTVFLVLFCVALMPVYLLLRLTIGVFKSPGSLRLWSRSRKSRAAQERLTQGLTALAEGRWQQAEKRLTQSVERGANPLLGYLASARAAQALGAHQRRDNYLAMASSSKPTSSVAVGITQAELQLDDEQREQALATLLQLRSQAPSHGYVLGLLRELFEELQDWKNLLELVPSLKQRKLIDVQESEALELQALSGLLIQSAESSDTDLLQWRWETIPKNKRVRSEVLEVYAELMLERGGAESCESLIRTSLNREWNDRLAYLYGLVTGSDAGRQLKEAESWLSSREHDPTLLLTLGRLCARSRLWGKARSYLETSISIDPRAETYRVLAEMLDELGEGEAAGDYARKGLVLATTGRGRYVSDLSGNTVAAVPGTGPQAGEGTMPSDSSAEMSVAALPTTDQSDARQSS